MSAESFKFVETNDIGDEGERGTLPNPKTHQTSEGKAGIGQRRYTRSSPSESGGQVRPMAALSIEVEPANLFLSSARDQNSARPMLPHLTRHFARGDTITEEQQEIRPQGFSRLESPQHPIDQEPEVQPSAPTQQKQPGKPKKVQALNHGGIARLFLKKKELLRVWIGFQTVCFILIESSIIVRTQESNLNEAELDEGGLLSILTALNLGVLLALLMLPICCFLIFCRRRMDYITFSIYLTQVTILLRTLKTCVVFQGEHYINEKHKSEAEELGLFLMFTLDILYCGLTLFFNTFQLSQILQSRVKQLAVIIVSVPVYFASLTSITWGALAWQVEWSRGVAVEFVILFVSSISGIGIFVYVLSQHNIETLKFMFREHIRSNKFRRMVDSIGEAIFVLEEEKNLTFKNKAAERMIKKVSMPGKLLEAISPGLARSPSTPAQLLSPKEFTTLPAFFAFKQSGSDSEREEQGRSEGYSLCDIVELLKKNEMEGFIFTFHRDIALCEKMNRLSLIVEIQESRKNTDNSFHGFDFFIIKLFELENFSVSEQRREFVVEILDISEKIFASSISTERQYLTYINSAVSHEIRNPLNSISAQLDHVQQTIQMLTDKDEGSPEVGEQPHLEGLATSINLAQSSCKLLSFNMENIMTLPRIKEGKMSKHPKLTNLSNSIREVQSIQAYQAAEKNIKMMTLFQGFSGSSVQDEAGHLWLSSEKASKILIHIDEKRFQQVLLNYQSNALKFIDRPKGSILTLLQLIPKHSEGEPPTEHRPALNFFKREMIKFYGQQLPSAEVNDDIFFKGSENKIVLSVFDDGVGIAEPDQAHLYKLFGCLKTSGRMGTKGIGLGLTIAKLISDELEGSTALHSKEQVGSVFQSSFLVPESESSQTTQKKLLLQAQRRFSICSSVKSLFLEGQVDMQINQANLKLNKESLANYREMQANPDFSYNQRKILIIDDEIYNCFAIKSLIQILKFPHCDRVEICLSGKDAIDKIKSGTHPVGDNEYECDYGLILTDCSMPFMDGYECCKEILKHLVIHGITSKKGSDDMQGCPVIVAVTGHVEPQYQVQAVLSGMQNIFSKPISAATVAKILLQNKFEINPQPSVLSQIEIR